MSDQKMKVEVDGKYLRIKIPLQEATESSSGKTMVVASTHGNVATGVEIDGKEIRLGLNAYYYARDKGDRKHPKKERED